MRRLTAEEWAKFPVYDGGLNFTTELEYYMLGDALGVVLLDNVDHDYSFAVLRYDRTKKEWRAVEVEVSMPTIEAARKKLEAVLTQQRGN